MKLFLKPLFWSCSLFEQTLRRFYSITLIVGILLGILIALLLSLALTLDLAEYLISYAKGVTK